MKRLVILALLSAPLPALAHPHVFVDSSTEIVFDDQGRISALRHEWTFDEMYSAYATQGLDKAEKGKFSREELQELANLNVEGLGEFNYFTFMQHGARKVSFENPKEPWGSVADKKLTLHFLMPLKTPFAPKGSAVTLQVYDQSFFVSFSLAEGEPARLKDAPKECRLDFEAGKGDAKKYIPDDQVAANPAIDYGRDSASRIVVKCP